MALQLRRRLYGSRLGGAPCCHRHMFDVCGIQGSKRLSRMDMGAWKGSRSALLLLKQVHLPTLLSVHVASRSFAVTVW